MKTSIVDINEVKGWSDITVLTWEEDLVGWWGKASCYSDNAISPS